MASSGCQVTVLVLLLTIIQSSFTSNLRYVNDQLRLQFLPQDVTTTFGETVDLNLLIDGYSYTNNFSVQFSDIDNSFVEVNPQKIWFYDTEFQNNVTKFQAIGRRPGRFIVKASVEPERFVDDQRLFVRLKVALNQPLIIISLIIGWTYTACWSSGYYPQIYLNYKRQNVVGLSFDFLHINIVGHLSYAIFNSFMYWNSAIQQEYYKRHPYGLNPVIGNDVGFAVHACFATGFTILQCYIYENGGNSISKTAKAIIILYFHIIIGAACSVWFWSYHWLDFLYVLSYIKLSTTLVKYFPQAYMNYKRQSTEGFAIMNRLLDIAGGLFGILQMVINAWNFDDWQSILGDPVKFGLGLFSILFDLVFIVQHYCLYRSSHKSTKNSNAVDRKVSYHKTKVIGC